MYYNDSTVVYFNHRFVKAAEATGNIYSQSLHYGYGVFEGIRAYNTRNGVKIFKPVEHFERLKYSCEAIGIPYPYNTEELIQISYEVLQRNNLKDAYIRPLVTCSPNMQLTKGKESHMLIAAWEWGAYLGEKLLRVMTSTVRRPNAAAFKIEAKVTGHYVNSIMASQEAKDQGFDEALLLDSHGFIAEGPGANIFIERNGILYTPKKGNILPGITRATVIDLAIENGIEVIETEILPEQIKGADSAFFCGTAAEIIGIESLDNIPFKMNWKDTLGAILQLSYKNLVLEKVENKLLAAS